MTNDNQKAVEPIVINYDKNGTPTTVVLHHEDYLALLKLLDRDKKLDIRTNKFRTPAKGYYVDTSSAGTSFCVLKGSKAAGSVNTSLKECHLNLREELIKNGILGKTNNGSLEFTKNYEFNSPSAAACIIEGTSKSGTEAWGKKN